MGKSAKAESTADLISNWTESIQQRPLMALGVAAGAGFVMGGGVASRLGLALLAFAVRTTIREATISYIRSAANK